ncbi:type II/IV secretion system ATPase subunit [Methanoregula sp.]|uniref:type II/IV secretion system ATPase subunit n=1 Tax=Methanoregula sp. TaxID=2052170 RepID=UPI0039C9EA51
MKSHDDESQDDVSTLLKKIRGIQAPEKEPAVPAVAPPPEKAPGKEEPEAGGTGDFSALMKKLGMAPAAAPAENEPEATPPEDTVPPVKEAPADEPSEDFDDLLEDVPPSEPVTETPPISSNDVRAALGKIVGQAPPPPPEEKPAPAATPPPAEPAVEIINEDPRDKGASLFFKKKKEKAAGGGAAAAEEPLVTDADERIISADQISEYSGLILPKGATFQIEELKLHGRINAFETTGTGTLPPELAEIWKREFSTAGFKDLESEFIPDKDKTERAAAKKSGFAALFSAIRSATVEYDPKIHGPLVDLTFDPKPGIEVMEMYPVNEPYAYVRVIYDHSTHEYTYLVIEPVLSEPEKDLLKELKERLFETLDINTKDISKEEARQQLRTAVDDILADYGIKLNPVQREKLLYNMHKDFLGDGLIDAIMHDKYIEDISCDGVNTPLFAFHASYESMKTTLMYHNAEELDSFVTKLAQRAGKYISIAEPILDATMSDGSRIQMTLGQEVTAHGSTFTIRKFKDEPITPTDLIEWHTFAPLSIAYIWLAVENGKSAIFAGGTASGKTTSLNAISLFIPPMAKIVSLEDTREVKLPHPNWIPSITRDSFDTAGRGEINMYELLRAAMRQRPEYIIVGEVRGKECQTLFQAMSTGHVTYSTIHADSVSSVVHRIENPPMDVPRNMLSALDIVCIQVQARMGGKRIRRNKQIVEILDIDPRTNELITNEVFRWRSATDEITYSGKSFILEDIMEARGWNENRMREELKRRQEVLEWMRIKKIRHYKDVAKILISYFREPEVVIERVRKDLYE